MTIELSPNPLPSFAAVSTSTQSSLDQPAQTKNNEIGLFGKYLRYSPGNFEKAAGGTSDSFSNIAPGLTYLREFGKWAIGIEMDYYSSTHLLSGTASPGEFISFNGFDLLVMGERSLYEAGNFGLWFGAGTGISSNTFQTPTFKDPNSTSSNIQLRTTSVLVSPILATLQMHYRLPQDFDLFANFGYQIKSIKALPYSTNADHSYNSADISLNAPFLSVGIASAF